jgi:hypothetical protein
MAGPGNRGINFPEQLHQPRQEPGWSPTGQGTRPEESGASGMVETMKEKAQDFASDAASRAQETWETTRQGAQQAATAAEDAFFGFRDFLGRYPFATLCAGIGFGFLLARAFDMMSDTSRYTWRD